MFFHLIHLFSTVFYIGYLKPLPGSFSSLLTAMVFYLLFPYLSFYTYLFIFFIFLVLSIYICHWADQHIFIESDSKSIVLDESIGMFISFLPFFFFKELSLFFYLLSFLLFRFFDILKPFPISYLDKNHRGGFSIVFDDILAGIFTASIVYLVLWIQKI